MAISPRFAQKSVSSFAGTSSSVASVLTGTVAVSAGTASVVGTSTLFTSELSVGDVVNLGGFARTVVTITNNTSMTVDNVIAAGVVSTKYFKVPAGTINIDPDGTVTVRKSVQAHEGLVVGIRGNSDAPLAFCTENSTYVTYLYGTTQTANRTIEMPDLSGTLPVCSQPLVFSGPSAARTVTLPDANCTVARIDAGQTFASGTHTFSGSGETLGAPVISLTGAWDRTSASANAQVLIAESGATAFSGSTSGTGLGINMDTASGNFIDCQVDGVSKAKIDSAGAATAVSFNTTNGVINGNGLAGSSWFITSGPVISGASGYVMMRNNAGTGPVSRVCLGPQTTSHHELFTETTNGLTLRAADTSTTWNDPATANSGTLANRYCFGIAAPTFTSTGTSVTDTVASTVYIGGAPTASTNTTITTPYALNVNAGVSKFGGPVIHKGYTVATLPATAAAGMVTGARAYVTDATAPTYNGALTGGGAVTVPVFYNGAAWVSA